MPGLMRGAYRVSYKVSYSVLDCVGGGKNSASYMVTRTNTTVLMTIV